MVYDDEMVWFFPDGEVTVERMYQTAKTTASLMQGKPSGTLLMRRRLWAHYWPIEWVEKIGPAIRNHHYYTPPPHIKLKCLLLGIAL